MERGNEGGQERFEQLDKEGLQCSEELIDVCQLQNALVCHLDRTLEGQVCRGGSRLTTKINSRSLTKDHLTAYPSFSYVSSEFRPSMRASRMRELTGDAAEAAACDAAGVKERDQRMTPPGGGSQSSQRKGKERNAPLWEMEQWSSMAAVFRDACPLAPIDRERNASCRRP